MEVNLQCQKDGRPCWNVAAIQNYANEQRDTAALKATEQSFANPYVGQIVCEGTIVNEHGMGELCAAWVNPSGEMSSSSAMKIPSPILASLVVPGFIKAHPPGSSFDDLFNHHSPRSSS